MKTFKILAFLILYLSTMAFGQTLYVPSGTAGIGNNTTNTNVGIGISVPPDKLTIGGGTLGIFGSGLDGSTYQRTVIYSDLANGLYFDAPKNSAGTKMNIQFNWRGGGIPALLIQGTSGNIGIGTTQPDYKLTVSGKIKAEEVQVVIDVPADYVFEKDYSLMPLFEVEKYVNENNHLPGVPDGKTLIKNGWQVGEMNNKLLEKVEELTLYMIQLKKENEALKLRVNNLERNK